MAERKNLESNGLRFCPERRRVHIYRLLCRQWMLYLSAISCEAGSTGTKRGSKSLARSFPLPRAWPRSAYRRPPGRSWPLVVAIRPVVRRRVVRPAGLRNDPRRCAQPGAVQVQPAAAAAREQRKLAAIPPADVVGYFPPHPSNLVNILRRHAKHDLTDRLVVQYAPLALLRDRVDVAQTAFERIFLEHRHRAAIVKQRIDDLP
jgi:hypothetical protein